MKKFPIEWVKNHSINPRQRQEGVNIYNHHLIRLSEEKLYNKMRKFSVAQEVGNKK